MTYRIYVQIPAYRDPELLATVEDLIRTSSHPDRLVVAVAWQFGPDEEQRTPALERLAPVRLTKIRAADSEGCNWARSLLQSGWAGEEYTLFLDSHHRFVPGWDDALVHLLEQQRRVGSAKPVITGYLPPYDPLKDPEDRVRAVYDLDVAERYQGLVYRLHGRPVEQWERLAAPSPARFSSLHFLFADGTFNLEVPCDPEIYFFADEVAIALRAFSHGYDLYRPNSVLGWHLYDRTTRGTHWSDHPGWEELRVRSIARLRVLYGGNLIGPYGLGPKRTVSDYESYAGIRLMQYPGPIQQEVQSWSSQLARALASPRSTGTPTTSNRI